MWMQGKGKYTLKVTDENAGRGLKLLGIDVKAIPPVLEKEFKRVARLGQICNASDGRAMMSLRAGKVHDMLELVSDENCVKMGLNPKRTRPEWMILTIFPVAPMVIRPNCTLLGGAQSKKGGKLRMCIDYCGLNRITRNNAYPLPRIDDLLDAAGGCKVFSKIDLKSGYHQIEVDPANQHKTAFKTRDGLYEFTGMPFGFMNTPTTFQSLMDMVLREQIGRFVVVYLDDILIFNKSMEEHIKHLEEVFTILEKMQVHLNSTKSEFGRDSVIYLGHRLFATAVEPVAIKVEVISYWPQPANIRELRSFLGLASYYRKFVPCFAIVARPLSRLTSKNVPYVWDTTCEDAFQALKEALIGIGLVRSGGGLDSKSDCGAIGVGSGEDSSKSNGCVVGSGVRHLLWQSTAAGASMGPACVVSCGRVEQRACFWRLWQASRCGGGTIPKDGRSRQRARSARRGDRRDGDGGYCRHREHDILNTMSDMSSSSRDMLTQLRKRRALLHRIAEASDCVAMYEAVVQLCAALSSSVFPRQTLRWWIKRRTGGTWDDLRLCDDATDEYYRQKLRMSMTMFRQIVAACAAYVEKKVTHYRMSLPVEQVIAFSLYRWASGETYESGTSAFGISRATGLQAVRDVTSALLQAYPDAIKWPVGCRRAQILRAFRDKGFSNCFGAIDCTHIYIDKPAGAPSNNYYDRKQKFSVQAQVVVELTHGVEVLRRPPFEVSPIWREICLPCCCGVTTTDTLVTQKICPSREEDDDVHVVDRRTTTPARVLRGEKTGGEKNRRATLTVMRGEMIDGRRRRGRQKDDDSIEHCPRDEMARMASAVVVQGTEDVRAERATFIRGEQACTTSTSLRLVCSRRDGLLYWRHLRADNIHAGWDAQDLSTLSQMDLPRRRFSVAGNDVVDGGTCDLLAHPGVSFQSSPRCEKTLRRSASMMNVRLASLAPPEHNPNLRSSPPSSSSPKPWCSSEVNSSPSLLADSHARTVCDNSCVDPLARGNVGSSSVCGSSSDGGSGVSHDSRWLISSRLHWKRSAGRTMR
ncbi:hypothetical protein CBR_g25 [Chara braunii]|uniref:DNA-directed RNA polymerase n=1 Tax=Chara braunii TaxID=69332 RepID=A0A388JLL6_CHABU|nr:hypothetical protein CBR_g25 [Chara braunii]|eukprot:GBG58625.1 hypothetical protein CBR_g25 [Chara braunii]